MHESGDGGDDDEHDRGDLVEVETEGVMEGSHVEPGPSENLHGATLQVDLDVKEEGEDQTQAQDGGGDQDAPPLSYQSAERAGQ